MMGYTPYWHTFINELPDLMFYTQPSGGSIVHTVNVQLTVPFTDLGYRQKKLARTVTDVLS